MATILEDALEATVTMRLQGDNDTARVTIEKGYSRAMAYLKSYDKTSISSMSAVWMETAGNVLARSDTTEMVADPMTKPLDAATHWRHFQKAGLRLVPLE